MPLDGYKSIVSLINDGDMVDASTINRVLSDLEGNTSYLKQLFEDALLGSAQFAFGQTVETDALVGQPVHYNATNQQFERALASAYVDDGTGLLTTAPSSQVWGVVYRKNSSTNADIMLSGYAPLDLTNAGVTAVAAQVYYLSGTIPGGLQPTAPPVGIPVLRADGEGNVLLFPSFSDVFATHRHYKYELLALPAGEHEGDPGSGPHVIVSPDDSVEGWLPASASIFNSTAPADAKFGYNISASPLAALWPPMPIDSAYIEWNKGLDIDVGGTGVQVTTAAPLVVIDANGIWWMSDAYKDVPWPYDLDTSTSLAEPVIGQDPREMAMSLTLWFTKMQFQTDSTAVTSLTAGSDKVTVTCAHDGTVRSTGDLVVDVAFENLVDSDDDETGYMVFKDYDAATQTFFRGPAVAALRAGANVTLASSDVSSGDYRNVVTVSAVASPVGTEYQPEEVRLNGVEEENYEDTLGLGFPADRDSEFRAKIRIPANLTGVASLTMKLRFQFLARAAGDLPAFDIAYRRIPRPSGQTALPTTDTALPIAMTAGAAITTDEYVEIESDAFTVLPGDQLLFTVMRSGSTDSFTGAVHVIDLRAVVTAVTMS